MAGVFINYRAADNPLGAAGIHDGLVRLFGASLVFRDCVSMLAGTNYPPAIRAALADADVVVAVIGPQWLTARDESAGVRLIDRSYDWVRRELAWAFQHDIHVVPVVLKDTPANAKLPTLNELPDNIHKLALAQAFSFSQLRFGADLDLLASRLVTLVPSLGASALRPVSTNSGDDSLTSRALPKSAFFEVVDALLAVPCIYRRYSRHLIVERLRPEISTAIQYIPERRAHVVEILRKCMNYDGGVAELLSLVRDMDANSPAWRQLTATVNRLLPGVET